MLRVSPTIAPCALAAILLVPTPARPQVLDTESQAIALADSLLDRLDRQKAYESRLAALDKQIKNAPFEAIDAETTVEQARLTLQAYTELEQSERKSLSGQIDLARAALEMARNRVDWSQRMLKQNYIAPAEALFDQATLRQAEIDLMKAREKLKIYEQHTRPKTIKDLEKAIADAENAALALITQRPNLQRERDDLARRLEADKLLDEDKQALTAFLNCLEAISSTPPQPDVAGRHLAEANRLASLSESKRAPLRRADRTYRIRQTLAPPPAANPSP